MDLYNDSLTRYNLYSHSELKETPTIEKKSFKVIGYYPNWSTISLEQLQWNVLTHINYAFAIPTKDGEILKFPDTNMIKILIQTAHIYKVSAGLSVGGWSYNNELLEHVFLEATSTEEKCRTLASNIIGIVDEYNFDGVDLDWEYPREGITQTCYTNLVKYLHTELTRRGKYLSAAVIGGGTIGYGVSDSVLSMLDWINVMAYDGDNGSGHSPYKYTLECGEYWLKSRGVQGYKVIMGVPFYARPNWTTYREIIEKDDSAAYRDTFEYDGTIHHYNGLKTMQEKTIWACNKAGGMMIWELTQDCNQKSISLLGQIGSIVRGYYPYYREI